MEAPDHDRGAEEIRGGKGRSMADSISARAAEPVAGDDPAAAGFSVRIDQASSGQNGVSHGENGVNVTPSVDEAAAKIEIRVASAQGDMARTFADEAVGAGATSSVVEEVLRISDQEEAAYVAAETAALLGDPIDVAVQKEVEAVMGGPFGRERIERNLPPRAQHVYRLTQGYLLRVLNALGLLSPDPIRSVQEIGVAFRHVVATALTAYREHPIEEYGKYFRHMRRVAKRTGANIMERHRAAH